MSQRHPDHLWGFCAPISPVFTLVYYGALAARAKAVVKGIWEDKPTFFAIVGMILVGALSAAFAPDKKDAFLVMWAPVLLIVFYALGRWAIRSPHAFAQGVVLGCGFLGVIVVLARLAKIEWAIGSVPILTGFRNPTDRCTVLGMYANGLAAMMEAGVVGGVGLAIYTRRSRRLNIAAAIAAMLGIFNTYSRGAMVAVAVTLLILLAISWDRWRKHWRYAAVGMAVALVALLFWPQLTARIASIFQLNEHGNSVRLYIWKTMIPMLLDHWLIGSGPGNFTTVHSSYLPGNMIYAVTPHSLYMFILSGWGLLGFATFFGWLGWTTLRPLLLRPAPWRRVVFAMTAAFWVHVFFDDLFVAHVPLLMGLVARPELDEAADAVSAQKEQAA